MNTQDLTKYIRAGNPSISQEELAKLIFDDNADVRLHAAENPTCSKSMLWRLLHDSNQDVRSTALQHKNTPTSWQLEAAVSEGPDIRYELADNANTEECVLLILLHDENPYVSSRAWNRLNQRHAAPRLVSGDVRRLASA